MLRAVSLRGPDVAQGFDLDLFGGPNLLWMHRCSIVEVTTPTETFGDQFGEARWLCRGVGWRDSSSGLQR
jgi:hypothetical protein